VAGRVAQDRVAKIAGIREMTPKRPWDPPTSSPKSIIDIATGEKPDRDPAPRLDRLFPGKANSQTPPPTHQRPVGNPVGSGHLPKAKGK
jgi:hypothetical protein